MMAPASKSSPLLLAVAAALALAAALASEGFAAVTARLNAALRTRTALALLAFLAFAAASIFWAHNGRASMSQVAQLGVVTLAGASLAILAPAVAPRRRAILFAAGIAIAAAIMAVDLMSGLWFRNLTGGRDLPYAYNRGLVTLTLLLW
ncbi:MAG: hypothetical protein ACRCTI_16095, partial [Beijerinckiaceae bacterium]